MFDYHMHSTVSFDARSSGLEMALAAKAAGLKEICFTDHLDYDPLGKELNLAFDTAVYNAEYDNLEVPGLKIRCGAEFGMTVNNLALFKEDLKRRHFDFILGSIHFVDQVDVYYDNFWRGKTVFQAERRYFEAMLDCVRLHEDFDVLSHMTFIGKTDANPARRCVPLDEHRELVDEILRTVAQKGKGIEVNTSGMDRCGGFLPTADYVRRFKELGGEIVTVGSDAHFASRVGQYTFEVCDMLKDILGYVCTFEDRKPIFHKL